MIYLKNLRASSVRGLPKGWESLPIAEHGLIIYGSNGSGKSSVVDALEYVLTNKSTLFVRNRTGVNWELGAPHVKDGKPDIVLEISDGEAPYSIKLEQDISLLPKHIQEWIRLAKDTQFVLRRYMLLDFINIDPADRYSNLESFLNLEKYLSVENGLDFWVNTLDTQIAITSTKVNSISQSIRTAFKLEPTTAIKEAELLHLLNAKLAEVNIPECSSRSQLDTYFETVVTELGDKDVTSHLEKLGDLKGQVQRLSLPKDLAPLLKQVIAAQTDLGNKLAETKSIFLGKFLIEAKTLIEENNLAICPVCEQDIDITAVIERLKLRIETDRQIIDAKDLAKKTRVALLGEVRSLLSGLATFKNAWEDNLKVSFPADYAAMKSTLEGMNKLLGKDKVSVADLQEYAERFPNLVQSHGTVLNSLNTMITQESGGFRRLLLLDTKTMLESLRTDAINLHEAENQRDAQTTQRNTIAMLYQHSVEARKAAIRIILNSVAALANDMYKQIHPSEEIAKSKLSVREATLASVALTTEFYGKEENPLLHYSESHLDTLGLCYFLAFRKRAGNQQPDFKVLVLDDVMHSVDAEHRQRICALLKEHFSDHQLIITTHDSVFYDRLRETLGGSKLEYVRFSNWYIDRGPVLGDSFTDIDRICCKDQRDTKSSNELASACGRFMEMLLKRLTERLQISVVARFENRYTINDLWPPLYKKLRQHEGFATIHPKLPDQINENRWIRNECGAHHNEKSVPPTPEEVREIAEGLAALYSATHCEDCGEYINRQSNGDWRCKCSNGGINYPP